LSAARAPWHVCALASRALWAGQLGGYTIVEADDLAAAKAMTDGLPFLSNSDGKCAVEIFELLSM
jgi:hypothetical protein